MISLENKKKLKSAFLVIIKCKAYHLTHLRTSKHEKATSLIRCRSKRLLRQPQFEEAANKVASDRTAHRWQNCPSEQSVIANHKVWLARFEQHELQQRNFQLPRQPGGLWGETGALYDLTIWNTTSLFK